MRISPGVLLVLVGIAIPVVVELRTLLGFFDIYVSAEATALAAAVVVGVLVLWALLPESDAPDRSRTA